jgi:HAD superfamily hydrolase (TIGR01509 family)
MPGLINGRGGVETSVDAIVFDCDGVLVDSEVLSIRVQKRVLSDLGWEVEEADVAEMFMGCSKEFLLQRIETQLGRTLEPHWDAPYAAWFQKAFDEELREISGIANAIDDIALPKAVASNSSHKHVRSSLKKVGLLGRFEGLICSADDVARGKPAPDVYLLAANRLGVQPERCLAVEDSEFGAEAARSAGMQVLAYKTSLTPPNWFTRPDITVFRSMAQLPDLVRQRSER